MKFLKVLLVILPIGISLSCKKSNYTETPEDEARKADTYAASTMVTMDAVLNELQYIADQARQDQTLPEFLSCATITRETIAEGTKVTITFNPNSYCTDENWRSGKLIILYPSTGDQKQIVTENYKLGNMGITGTYYFESITEQQKPLTKLTVQDAKFTVPNGDYVQFEVERKSHFKEGSTTQTTTDDVYEVLETTYEFELKDRGVFTLVQAESTVPLILKFSCPQKFRARAGRIKFTRLNSTEKYLVFGNGRCEDNPFIANP